MASSLSWGQHGHQQRGDDQPGRVPEPNLRVSSADERRLHWRGRIRARRRRPNYQWKTHGLVSSLTQKCDFITSQRESLRTFCLLLHDVRNNLISPSVSVYTAQKKHHSHNSQTSYKHMCNTDVTDNWNITDMYHNHITTQRTSSYITVQNES